VLLVLRREDVFCPFVRQKNVHEKFSLYRVPLCREMSACDCSFVQMGLYCVTRGQIRIVVHCLTDTKGSKEIGVVGGNLRKLAIQMSRWELRVSKHEFQNSPAFRIAPFPTDDITPRNMPHVASLRHSAL